MTAGNNGASENDDPFAYLYRSEGGEGESSGAAPEGATVAQPGVPRTSYNQVQRVGERRPPQQGGYGYPPQQPQPGYDQGQGQGYAQQQPQQHQQERQPQYTQQTQYAPHDGGDGPQGPNRKGLLIGAIAVVAVVAIGIGYAMTSGDGKKDNASDKPSTQPSASAPVTPSQAATTPETFSSKVVDAATLSLSGGAAPTTAQPGAKAAGGTSVGGLTTVGAAATYTFDVPKDGTYTLFISFGNVGEDAGLTLSENGKLRTNPVNMRNYMKTADWTKAWATTYVWVDLKKGSNTLALTCAPGNKCGVNLDQVWMKEGQVKK